MRRFLVCSGVHGRIESLEWLHEAVRQRRPDGVLFAGGVLDRERTYAPTSTTCWGHTRSDTNFLQSFFASLGGLGVFTAIIPGVFDAPLDLFLRLGMNAEIEYPRLHVVHATPIEEGDVAVVGLGACITDYTSMDIGYYSRNLADYYFRSLWKTSKPRTVLLLPEPPQSWLGEVENHRMANALVTTYQPGVCVLGRSSKGRGVERIADTLVINPGHLSDGNAACLDWDRPASEQVEFLDLRSVGTPRHRLALGDGEGHRRAGQAAGV
jgi:Metallophosphoesterase, calcineurin superfamily